MLLLAVRATGVAAGAAGVAAATPPRAEASSPSSNTSAMGVLTATPSVFAPGTKNLAHSAIINSFQFHGGLIGFDFCQDVTGDNLVTFGLEPARNAAFGHGW